MYDIIIKNGCVIDGTGNPWFRADVAISDGKITKIGRLDKSSAETVVDAKGLVVAPGFIDMHSHSDLVFPLKDHAEILSPFIRQGVTTQAIGNCGMSPAPAKKDTVEILKATLALITPREFPWTWYRLSEYLDLLAKQGVAMNVVPLVGHGAIRIAAMGLKAEPPTKDELEAMKNVLTEAMEDGAFGLSAGLIYSPGMWSTTDELIELCRIVAKYDGLFTCHARGFSALAVPAQRETIEIGEKTGVSVQHSHHQAFGKPHWGKIEQMIKMVEEAREKGVDIAFDVIPYTTANTTILAIYPPWSLEGGVPQLIERLKNPEIRAKIKKDIEETVPTWPPWGPGGWPHNIAKATGWENIILIFVPSEKNKPLEGKSLAELGKKTGKHPFDAISDLVIEEGGNIMALYVGLSGDLTTDEPLFAFLKHPLGAIVSDAILLGKGIPHPGAYGCYPRTLGHYARELKLFTLEEAVRKITSLPAERLKLRDRGLIVEGMSADITIFNPIKVKEKATYENPFQYPEGIEYVIINGKIVVEKGEHDTKVLAGKVLRKKH